MEKGQKKRTKASRVLKIIKFANEEVDVDYIEQKIAGGRKKILRYLQFLKQEGLIEKNFKPTNSRPYRKLYVKISPKGLWVIKKKNELEKKNGTN